MLLRFFLASKRSKGARLGLGGDEEESLELGLTLDGEVLNGELVVPVVGERLVEGRVLVGGDLLGVASPEGLGLVELLLLDLELLDLLPGVVLLGVFVIASSILAFFSSSLAASFSASSTSVLTTLVTTGWIRVRDELGVLLDDHADALLLDLLHLVLLEEETHLGTAANGKG